MLCVLLVLRRGGKISTPKIEGCLTAGLETKSLRFVGYLNARGLEPGGYDPRAQTPGPTAGDNKLFLRRGFVTR